MPRQVLPQIKAPGSYSGSWTAVTWTAADPTDKEEIVLTGRQLLLIRNTHADTDYYVTINSVDNQWGRSEDIHQVDIGDGEMVVWGPIALDGWQQPGGLLFLEAENAAIEYAVITLP